MTLPLARDLAKYGVRVNSIAPGTFIGMVKGKVICASLDMYICDVSWVCG